MSGSVTVGSGPDTLGLIVYEEGQPDGAQFTTVVDGTQIGGAQTTTADASFGNLETLFVLGDFAPGTTHTVSVNYLNANHSLLVINGATINGNTIFAMPEVASEGMASVAFSFATPLFTPVCRVV